MTHIHLSQVQEQSLQPRFCAIDTLNIITKSLRMHFR